MLLLLPILLIADKLIGGKWIYPHIATYFNRENTNITPNTLQQLDQSIKPNLSLNQDIIKLDTTPIDNKIIVGNLPTPEQYNTTGKFYTANFWKNATVNDVIAELENNANINARNQNGQTILMYAVSANTNPELINILLMYGANLFARDNTGRTALMFASAMNPNPSIITTLIKNGSSPTTTDKNSWSPLTYAVAHNPNPQVINVLLQNNNNINAKLSEADRAWHHASLSNQFIELTKIALRQSEKLITNIYLALGNQGDYMSIIENSLDELNNEINAPDTGMTPLMIASKYNPYPSIIRYLLSLGADVTLYDNKGKTALDYAKENPHLYQTDVYWQMNDKLYNKN